MALTLLNNFFCPIGSTVIIFLFIYLSPVPCRLHLNKVRLYKVSHFNSIIQKWKILYSHTLVSHPVIFPPRILFLLLIQKTMNHLLVTLEVLYVYIWKGKPHILLIPKYLPVSSKYTFLNP